MIGSFKDKRTERFYLGGAVKEYRRFEEAAETRLARLDAAESLADLAKVPGNHLELLLGDRKGFHSIRINRQWRICFRWNEKGKRAEEVEIVDYH